MLKKLVFLGILLALSSPIVALKRVPLRVVSLSPIVTEILMAIGVEDHLVGVTRLCDYPPRVQKKNRIGDYKPNPKIVKALAPTHILGIRRDKILEAGIDRNVIHYQIFTAPETVADVINLIQNIGASVGHQSQATALIDKIEVSLKKTRSIAKSQPPKRLAMLLWHDPMMAIGSQGYLGEAIQLSGVTNLFEDDTQQFVKTGLNHILSQKPTHILCTRKATYDTLRSNLKLDRYLQKNNIKLDYIKEVPNLTRPGPQLPKLVDLLTRSL